MSSPVRSGLGVVRILLAVAFIMGGLAQPDFAAAGRSDVVAAHDPPDIPFRRAPMAISSRSIVVSLETNVHLAFDAELLRTHTVWEGAPLNLYGPPFNGTAARFVCDFSGNRLWGNLPVQPWQFARQSGDGFDSADSRFLGVSTTSGQTHFLYELIHASAPPVRIRETPRMERILSRNAVVRRFEIAPLAEPVRLSSFHGAGRSVFFLEGGNAVAVRRENDFLLIAARGLASNILSARRDDSGHAVLAHTERDGKGPYSAILTNTVSGPFVQISLSLPRSATAQAFEVGTVVCADQAEAGALARAFAAQAVLPARNFSPAASGSAARERPQKMFTPDPEFVDRPAGDESYTVEHLPVPEGIKLLVGGLDFLPNGDLAICTCSGEIWIVEGVTDGLAQARWRLFARGLNEPGGLRVINGQIYVTQKCELTRVSDTDGNGGADLFECISDGWGYTGNYHSFTTGPALDAQGNFYVMITGHRPIFDVQFMGWCVRVSPNVEPFGSDGFGIANDSFFEMTDSTKRYAAKGYCSGLRVPNGFGEFNGDIFMTDNQGHWIAANKLNHLEPDQFYGYPPARPAPVDWFNGHSDFTPPAVWFPYAWVRSASGLVEIADERFGPFQGQMLVGEFQNASLVRVTLEKVNGRWQGAVFPFVKGFASGVNRIAFGSDGNLYAGGLRMGHWTSIAPRPHSLDRVRFTGTIPFEIREVHAQPDGFTLFFTQEVDASSAGNVENWDGLQYTYEYDGHHEAPEKDRDEKVSGPPVQVTRAIVSADRRSVRLRIEGCEPRHVVMVQATGVMGADGRELRHDTFHYTLNQIPAR